MRISRGLLACFALPSLLAMGAIGLSGLRARGEAERPNVLVILVDDLGFGDLSCYGAPDLRTPNIDALVASGLRFEDAYANCPVCSPTRAALLSGRYPDEVGVPGVIRTDPRDNWGFLDPGAPLLPGLLKGAGYHSAIVGKWHLGLRSPNTPLERGFDEFRGFLGDMMDDYEDHRRHGRNYMRHGAEEVDPEGHATDLFSRWAVEYLDSRKGRPEPFFLYLAYNAPHTPIQPPEAWVDRVKAREPGIDEGRAKLVALIEHLDDGVGRILRALEENGQRGETLVVFASDNGGQRSVGARVGPYRGGKGDMYEGGLRVPMAASWPGKVEAGSSTGRVVLSMDLLPTICELAGVEVPGEVDGTSLVPTLLGRDREGDDERPLFWVRREGGPRYLGRESYAARHGPWKLVQDQPFEPFRLYNLDDDPMERRDVSAEHRPIAAALSRALMRHVQEAARVPWQRPAGGEDEEVEGR
ncbi:sulfatase-like hydrolase/transferase [Tautonia plasticadhaerens]|uniref:Arylsulfatase n=1 Tax=Tautonia plasticadhaerens TaxID=2527974 RepID=A0A518H4S0_9BACT|nr:sulfatase-like hydrolase/transferase [Tautonia plasticadhaerens]QDV35835.1 Arylsulfatase [Tautonia plasticadhaerens]